MAILKVKKVKGHEYFYWRKSVRSHKKFGGDGRVQTVDYLIGTTTFGQWLPYRLWAGDVALEPYTEAIIKYLCPRDWEPFVNVTISWDKVKPKVSITSIIPMFADCRSKRWRQQRQAVQSWVDRIVEDNTVIDRLIQGAAYLLGEHYRCSKTAEKLREKAREARLYPDNFVPNAEDILDEYAHTSQSRADQAMEYYLQNIETLEKLAPPSMRRQFHHQVISQAEKLARNKRWLEEYQVKLEERSCHSTSQQ